MRDFTVTGVEDRVGPRVPTLMVRPDRHPIAMSRKLKGRMRIFLAFIAALYGSNALASPLGEWVVMDKTARVLIRPCGANLCGKLSWSADGKDVGQAILINMKPDAGKWSGTVVDVRDGTRYLAHISMQSEQALKLDGCVLGGIICNGEVWTRYR